MAERLGEAILELSTRDTRFKAGLRSAERQAKAAGKAMTKFLTIPILLLGVVAGRAAAKFGDSMNKVISLTALTRDEVEGLVDDILMIGPALGKSPQELAEALFPIASAGNDVTQSLGILTVAAMASTAGFGTTEQAATTLNKVLASFRGEVDSSAEAMGILIATASEADALPDALALPIARFIPFARAAGIELRTILAEFALVTRGAGSAEEASTAMVGAIVALVKPAGTARDAIRAAGLPLEDLRAILEDRGVIAAIHAVEGALGTGTQAFDDFFQNIRGGLAVNILLNQSLDEVTRTMKVLEEAGVQSLRDTFIEAAQSPMFRFRQGLAVINASMIILGNAILPLVIPLMRQMTDWLVRASRAFAALAPETQRMILSWAGLIAIAGPVILAITLLVKGFVFLGLVVAKVVVNVVLAIAWMARMVTAALLRLVAFIFSVPGLIALAIGTMIGIFVAFRDTASIIWEEIGDFIWQKMKTTFTNVVNWVKTKSLEFVNLNIALLNKIREFLGLAALDFVAVPKFIIEETNAAIDTIRIAAVFEREIKEAKDAIVGTVAKMVTALKDLLPEGIMDMLFPGGLEQTQIDLESLLSSLGKIPKELAELSGAGLDLATDFEEVGAAIASSISQATTDAIVNLRSLADFAQSISNIILRGILEATLGAFITKTLTPVFGGAAHGGPITPGRPTIIGEEGPEILVTDRPGIILPNEVFQGLGRSGGAVTMVFQAGFSAEHLALVKNVAAEVAVSSSMDVIKRQFGVG